MRWLVVVIGLLIWQDGTAQRALELWRDFYSGAPVSASIYLRAGHTDSAGNFYMTGTARVGSENHLFILSLDPTGQERWAHLWLHPAATSVNWIGSELDPEGNLQVAVAVQIPVTYFVILHYSPAGNLIRQETIRFLFDLSSTPPRSRLRIAPDGSRYLLIGGFSSATLCKITPQAVLEWFRIFLYPQPFSADDLLIARDNNLYISGGIPQRNLSRLPALLKLNPAGDLLWRYQETSPSSDVMRLLGEDSLGRIGVQLGLTAMLFNPDGTLLWRRTYTPTEGSLPAGVDGALYPDGAMAITGRYRRFGFPEDSWISFALRLNGEGTLIWQRANLAAWQGLYDIEPLATGYSDGSLWVLSQSGSRSMPAFTMARLDAAGNLLWSRSFEVPANVVNLTPQQLLVNSDATVTGAVDQASLLRWFTCLSDGTVLNDQMRPVQIASHDRVRKLMPAPDGGVYAAIESISQRRLRRYSATGELLWDRSIGHFNDIAADSEGFIVALSTSTSGETASDIRLMRYAPDGQPVWTRAYPVAGSEWSQRLHVGIDGAIYVAATSLQNGVRNPLLLKVAPDGTLLWTVRRTENYPFAVYQTVLGTDGSLYVALINSAANELQLACYNSEGVLRWEATQPMRLSSTHAIAVDTAGRLFALSLYSEVSTTTWHLRCYSPQGVLLWSHSRQAADAFSAILAPTGDGGVYVLGHDLLLYNAEGQELWRQRANTLIWQAVSLITDSQANAYVQGIRWYDEAGERLNCVELRRYTRSGSYDALLCFEGVMRTRHGAVSPILHEAIREITIGGGAGDPEGVLDAFIARYRLLPRGDVNGDGCVDETDLIAILFAFGQRGPQLPEDLDGNGQVDDADMLIVLFGWGEGCD